MPLDAISCRFDCPFWANLSDMLGGEVFSRSLLVSSLGGVKSSSDSSGKVVSGGPGPHQEALS